MSDPVRLQPASDCLTSRWDVKSKIMYSDVAEWWDKCAKPEINKFCLDFYIQQKNGRDQTKQFLLSYLKIVLEDKN